MRRRPLAKAIERANLVLENEGAELVPEAITPHSLRHTCASVLFAIGWDPRRVMDHLGHADAKFSLRAYAKSMSRQPGEIEALRALVEGQPLVADEALVEERTTAADPLYDPPA